MQVKIPNRLGENLDILPTLKYLELPGNHTFDNPQDRKAVIKYNKSIFTS